MNGEPKIPAHWAASIGLGPDPRNELKLVKQQLEEVQAQNRALSAKLGNSRPGDDLEVRNLTQERDAWRLRAEKAEKKAEVLTKRRPQPKNAAHARLLRRLKRNIAREMRDAQQGFVIQKVTEKHGKTEVRRVAVDTDTLVLKWCKAQESFNSTSKWLNLRTVQRIDYGPKARASQLFPEAAPWLCFSLVTAERSYDFITSNDSSARCFVLCVSRLCEGTAEGILHTRGEFECRKGWYKLQTGLSRRGLTVGEVFLAALQQRAAALPPPEIVTAEASEADDQVAMLPDTSAEKPMDLFAFCDEPSSPSGTNCRKSSVPSVVVKTSSIKSQPPVTATTSGSVGPSFARTFTSWMTSPSTVSSPQGALPKAGETWVFTGCVDRVDLYRDSGASEWVNEMTCRGPNNERRMVTIVSVKADQQMVEIRGTDKLKFVKGWVGLLDSDGAALLEQAPK
mmetsp:Transcript_36895/g.82415  ORF Transcript_36895/g.82415 Transcript_36895/m.82415 type:complete len:452 (+) Transcript_36895:69-1424(+)